MEINQLTILFNKYPHLRDQSNVGFILEALVETETNGMESGYHKFAKFLQGYAKRVHVSVSNTK